MTPGLIVVPVQWSMPVRTVLALQRLAQPAGSGVSVVQEWTSPAEKRNFAITQFLSVPQFDWVFFLDSDMLPAPDTLTRLLATGCDVVGGLYAGRVFDSATPGPITYGMECGYFDRDNSPVIPEVVNKLAPVDWVGAGAMLVRRAVLEKLAPGPWFDNEDDIGFCRRVRGAGFQVHVDGRVRVGHLQMVPVMPGGTFLDLNIATRQAVA